MKIKYWIVALVLEVVGFIIVMTTVIFHGNSTESFPRLLGLLGLTWIFMGGIIGLIGSWGG